MLEGLFNFWGEKNKKSGRHKEGMQERVKEHKFSFTRQKVIPIEDKSGPKIKLKGLLDNKWEFL